LWPTKQELQELIDAAIARIDAKAEVSAVDEPAGAPDAQLPETGKT
jgi:hypothetical protein